jgi:SAM-dependent methyltransferase
MSHDREDSRRPAGQAVANVYDNFAEAYAAETESNLINGYYTRPAVLDLASDVAGRRILDVGCGAGPLLAALRERGTLTISRPASSPKNTPSAARNAVLTYWHRPLHAMTGAFTEAGFRIAVISEPSPAPGARELFPDVLARFPSGAFLCFLFFVLEAV